MSNLPGYRDYEVALTGWANVQARSEEEAKAVVNSLIEKVMAMEVISGAWFKGPAAEIGFLDLDECIEGGPVTDVTDDDPIEPDLKEEP